MNLPRSFSHSLLLPQCFVKYLPDAPGLQAFSGCLYSGWLPASFRCIPCHCHDCGVTDSSCIPCLDTLISPRFPLLLPAYGSAGTLPVPGSFLLRNPSHSISADTSHPLRLRSSPSDGNSSGRNTYDSHDLLHCIHRHSYPAFFSLRCPSCSAGIPHSHSLLFRSAHISG